MRYLAMNNRNRSPNSRAGFTLVELTVSSVAAAVLILGLASSLFLATETLKVAEGSQSNRASNARVLNQMLQNIRHALAFSERTSTALKFTVPDRDGDDDPETIRYAWSGTPGDPLTYEYNGLSAHIMIADVQSIDFAYATRLMVAPVMDISTPSQVVFEEFTETKLAVGGSSLSLNVPSGTVEGDLLIAAVGYDGALSAMGIAGWNEITVTDSDNKVTFGVWWKLATAAEPASHTCVWEPSDQAYGWMMRFTGHDPASPIHATAVGIGVSASPTSPAVTTTVDDAMILRIGGFDRNRVTTDDSGLSGNTTITMDWSADSSAASSGGSGYSFLASAGDSGTSTFGLTGSEEFVTITVAIAPEP